MPSGLGALCDPMLKITPFISSKDGGLIMVDLSYSVKLKGIKPSKSCGIFGLEEVNKF